MYCVITSVVQWSVLDRGLEPSWPRSDLNNDYTSKFDIYCFFDHLHPAPRGCAGCRIGTRFIRPKGTSPLKGVNPAGTP